MPCLCRCRTRQEKPIANSSKILLTPGLHFKQVHPSKPIYSVRITGDYRAVGIRDHEDMVWFWIGSHQAYDKLISQLLATLAIPIPPEIITALALAMRQVRSRSGATINAGIVLGWPPARRAGRFLAEQAFYRQRA